MFHIEIGQGWIRTSVRLRERFYRPPPLATRTPTQTADEGI